MEFRILGQVEVRGDRARAKLAGATQSALLVALLLRANHVVPLEGLVAATWDDEPPDSAGAALHTRIFRLRRALDEVETNGSGRIITHNSGYLLKVESGELDLEEFQQHVAQAREAIEAGHPAEALRKFDAALRLWRGPALSGVSGRFAQTQADGLDVARLTAVEDRIEVGLTLGRHAEMVAELTTLVAANPLRERLRGQLMLALYRCGQQAEALAVYRDIYRLLTDELGIQPDPQLQRLHRQMLAADPALNVPVASVTAATMPVISLVPQQLPTDVANFTGRERDLGQLNALFDGDPGASKAVVISAIAGTAGVGKTALALHWAHGNVDRFPHGQLYVNLRGYAAAGQPMAATAALAQFLRSLGVPQERIPLDQDEQAAMYRSLMADRRMLVLLDNVATADQVWPLLPGSSNSLVLITSRDDLRGLTSLQDVRRIVLDVLTPDEAHDLLARVLGTSRAQAEQPQVTELARLCGYLPLALRIAAAHLVNRPHESIASYVGKLNAGNRLAHLAVDEDPHVGVRVSFDLSYQVLTPDCARLFRLLGLVPGPDFSPDAAAALSGLAAQETVRLLDRLTAAHLLDCTAPDRYQFHDLLRLYAAQRAEAEDAAENRTDAVLRLLGWALHTTAAAAQLLYPEIAPVLRELPESQAQPRTFTDPVDALAWLDAERANLIAIIGHAVEHGPRELAWYLVDAMSGYFHLQMNRVDWHRAAEDGLRAARGAGDRDAEAAMLHSIAYAHFSFGEYAQVLEHDLQALARYRETGNTAGEAEVSKWSGLASWLLGRLEEASAYHERAVECFQATGNRAGEAISLTNLAYVFCDSGRFAESLDNSTRALAIQHEIGTQLGQALSMHAIAHVNNSFGNYDRALELINEVIARYRKIGYRHGEVSALEVLAMIHRDAGRHQEALDSGDDALALAEEINEPKSHVCALNTIGYSRSHLRQFDEAVSSHNRALELARTAGFRRGEVEALVGLATAYRGLERPQDALGCALTAWRAAEGSGFRSFAAHALTALAEIHSDLHEHDQAVEYARRAVDLHGETGHRLGRARALRATGTILQREDSVAAQEHWRSALALFTELGTPEAEQLRTVLDTAV
nr:BTAD domain-containing putative transcriptional regulator [Kibdelosporangium sp. MJ126-NF4]CEL12897.1 Pathway specific regulator [Kibdelosporangium sp. MJ126-NF4]CTQ98581.1 Pathway specific regulator [Kibdelosporangium sp. MJ126-NF4]